MKLLKPNHLFHHHLFMPHRIAIFQLQKVNSGTQFTYINLSISIEDGSKQSLSG
jgi:hypothetical protein